MRTSRTGYQVVCVWVVVSHKKPGNFCLALFCELRTRGSGNREPCCYDSRCSSSASARETMGDYLELANTLRQLNTLSCPEDNTRDQFWSVVIEEYISNQQPSDSLQRRLATIRLLDQLEKDSLLPPQYADRERVRAMNENATTLFSVIQRRKGRISDTSTTRSPSIRDKLPYSADLPRDDKPVGRSKRQATSRPFRCRFSLLFLLLLVYIFWVVIVALLHPHVVSQDAVLRAPRINRGDIHPAADVDKECPFRDSPIYRSVYVYPSPNETLHWRGPILSSNGGNNGWPWIDLDAQTRRDGTVHYNAGGSFAQYSTELIVRDIIMHPSSCLRTFDPDKATLFYVPYLASVDYHQGQLSNSYKNSPYAKALYDVIEGNYNGWEKLFGLTSKYWKRRGGSDHILVFSEPLHGLSHPRSRRGSFYYIHTQRQLRPPIVISVELSTTFVEMYPRCAAKNILVPYPNIDGRFLNGKLDLEVREMLQRKGLHNVADSDAALPAEKETALTMSKEDEMPWGPRPVTQFYSAGNHGSCRDLRKAISNNFKCTASNKVFNKYSKEKSSYTHGMRMATFCTCPGGDSPSAKRMYDSLLSGCIPVILSHDFVWPFSKELDPTLSLDPNDFSIRWNASDFDTKRFGEGCTLLDENNNGTMQLAFENVNAKEIRRLRHGTRKAAELFSFYRFDEGMVDNPLQAGVLPDGGAAHAVVDALASRASGVRWSACEEELKRVRDPDPTKFKC